MMRYRASGFSIVELMVAMTLSLVLLAGALAITYSSRVTFGENERVGRLQENGRFAIELLSRDLRGAGFGGCMRGVTFNSTLNSATTPLWDFTQPVQGFEHTGTGTWSPGLPAVVTSPRADGGDVVMVRTSQTNAGLQRLRTSTAMASSTSDIVVDKDPNDTLPNGQTVLVSDCSAASVFAVTAFLDGGATATLQHTAGGAVGVGPGNATADVGPAFRDGATIVPVDTVIYYVRDSDTLRNGARNPALWRIVGNGAPLELVEGVESLQILYGEDTNGDQLVDNYVTAAAVGNWNRVIAISLSMLVRSVEPNSPEVDNRTYTLLGTNVGPFNDRYQRTIFTTTVALRNATS